MAAATVKGTVAFGFALTAMPFLLHFLEPRDAVAVVVPLTTLLDFSILLQSRGHLAFQRVLPMLLLGAVGIPVGIYILLMVPGPPLKVFIAATVLLLAVLLSLGVSIPIRRERLARGLAGFLSGTLVTSAGMAGPPMVLLLLNQRVDRDEFRPTLASVLVLLNFFGVVSLTASRTITPHTALLSLILVPGALLGFFVASQSLRYLNAVWFRRLTIAVVMAAAVAALISAAITV
ncbi:MAG: sulfite exporter TauE/SafE family protein [Dehalococcoidia bacterium]